jgi:signal transduction histidine kinase
MKATRVFQLTALALVVVSAVQVGWWLFDQHAYTVEKVQAARTLYAGQARAAQALLSAGVAEAQVRELLPDIEITAGQAHLAAAADSALVAETARRYRQYAWEGSFFLLALAACIAVIGRALRAEARVLEEQDDFLALVSHQFKTPLASLQLSLETMALRPLAPEQSQALIERMLADLGRMESMVTQILESVRLERGRVDLRSEPVELAGAVARVLGALEERAGGQRIALTSDVAAGLYVLADPLALDVIVRNVLENAVAAVAAAGGGSVAVSARSAAGEVVLAVRDSGVGFRPADGKRLFEKFSRLHAGGDGGQYGTGLGLYIVKRLMQLADGRVTAESDGVGQGACFVLTWPAAAVPGA